MQDLNLFNKSSIYSGFKYILKKLWISELNLLYKSSINSKFKYTYLIKDLQWFKTQIKALKIIGLTLKNIFNKSSINPQFKYIQ